MLEDEGAQVLGPVGSVDETLAFIAERPKCRIAWSWT
jgi:hypothetical protein